MKDEDKPQEGYDPVLISRFVAATHVSSKLGKSWLDAAKGDLQVALSSFSANPFAIPPPTFSHLTINVFTVEHMKDWHGFDLVEHTINKKTKVGTMMTKKKSRWEVTTLEDLAALRLCMLGELHGPTWVDTMRQALPDHVFRFVWAHAQRQPLVFEVTPQQTGQQLLDLVSRKIWCSPQQLRLWYMSQRANDTRRPDELVPPHLTFAEFQLSRFRSYPFLLPPGQVLYTWVEIGKNIKNGDVKFGDADNKSLIFFRLYDPSQHRFQFIRYLFLEKDCKIASVVSKLKNALLCPNDQPLLFFEEVKPTMIDPINIEQTLTRLELTTGDIVIVQKAETDESSKFSTAADYAESVRQNITVILQPRENSDAKTTQLDLSKKTKAVQLQQKIDEVLVVGPHNQLHLYTATNGSDALLNLDQYQTLKQTYDAFNQQPTYPRVLLLFYELTSSGRSRPETIQE